VHALAGSRPFPSRLAVNPWFPLRDRQGGVVLDLSRVAILPSLALAFLMQLNSRCARRGQTLKLAAVQPQVRKVFAHTRLDEVFQFADSVEAAIE
jgi:anti-anti-sigma factor